MQRSTVQQQAVPRRLLRRCNGDTESEVIPTDCCVILLDGALNVKEGKYTKSWTSNFGTSLSGYRLIAFACCWDDRMKSRQPRG